MRKRYTRGRPDCERGEASRRVVLDDTSRSGRRAPLCEGMMRLMNQRDGHVTHGIPPFSNATSPRGPKSATSDAVFPPTPAESEAVPRRQPPLLQRSGCQKR